MGANPEHVCDEHEFIFPPETGDYCIACGMRKVDFETISELKEQIDRAMRSIGLTWEDLESFGSAIEGISETMTKDIDRIRELEMTLGFIVAAPPNIVVKLAKIARDTASFAKEAGIKYE